MKKYRILILALLALSGCDKIKSYSKRETNKIDKTAIANRFNKIKNKFNVAQIQKLDDISLLITGNDAPAAALFYSSKSAPAVHTKRFFQIFPRNFTNQILFAQIDLANFSLEKIGADFNVFTVPTIILFKNGKEIDRLVGSASFNTISNFISK